MCVHLKFENLLQGRCTWVNLAMKPEEESNEEAEAEEKEEEPDEPEPEVGPPLLTPLSQDAGQSLWKIFCQILQTLHAS